VVHLLAVVAQLALGDRLADLGGAQLLDDLVDLADGEVALMRPFLLALGADPGGPSRLVGRLVSIRLEKACPEAGR